jgi:hypothetical protein
MLSICVVYLCYVIRTLASLRSLACAPLERLARLAQAETSLQARQEEVRMAHALSAKATVAAGLRSAGGVYRGKRMKERGSGAPSIAVVRPPAKFIAAATAASAPGGGDGWHGGRNLQDNVLDTRCERRVCDLSGGSGMRG